MKKIKTPNHQTPFDDDDDPLGFEYCDSCDGCFDDGEDEEDDDIADEELLHFGFDAGWRDACSICIGTVYNADRAASKTDMGPVVDDGAWVIMVRRELPDGGHTMLLDAAHPTLQAAKQDAVTRLGATTIVSEWQYQRVMGMAEVLYGS